MKYNGVALITAVPTLQGCLYYRSARIKELSVLSRTNIVLNSGARIIELLVLKGYPYYRSVRIIGVFAL